MSERRAHLTGLVLTVLLVEASATRADVAFPGARRTQPRVRFENLGDYPEFTFYLVSGDEVWELSPGATYTLHRGVIGAYLAAGPKGEPGPTFDHECSSWWIEQARTGAVNNLVCASLDDIPGNDLIELDPHEYYLRPFRVAIRDGRLEATPLPLEGPLDPLRIILLAGTLSLLITAVGLWVARSGKKARESAASDPYDPYTNKLRLPPPEEPPP
jgi:hypothetical protein